MIGRGLGDSSSVSRRRPWRRMVSRRIVYRGQVPSGSRMEMGQVELPDIQEALHEPMIREAWRRYEDIAKTDNVDC